MNKPFKISELKNGVIIEFFNQSNRYFGDYHRVQINVIAMIPVFVDSLPEDLQGIAATYPDHIKYEKLLEQMGVATSEVESVTALLIGNFVKSVAPYLEKKSFAENLLRKSMKEKMNRSFFRPE